MCIYIRSFASQERSVLLRWASAKQFSNLPLKILFTLPSFIDARGYVCKFWKNVTLRHHYTWHYRAIKRCWINHCYSSLTGMPIKFGSTSGQTDTVLPAIADVAFAGHYSDVIIGAMASQITSLMIFYSTVDSGADQRKHQGSGDRWPVNSPHKGPVTRKMFPFDDVIMKNGACFRLGWDWSVTGFGLPHSAFWSICDRS